MTDESEARPGIGRRFLPFMPRDMVCSVVIALLVPSLSIILRYLNWNSELASHRIARVDVRQLPVHKVGGRVEKLIPRGAQRDRDLPRGEHGRRVPGCSEVGWRVRKVLPQLNYK